MTTYLLYTSYILYSFLSIIYPSNVIITLNSKLSIIKLNEAVIRPSWLARQPTLRLPTVCCGCTRRLSHVRREA